MQQESFYVGQIQREGDSCERARSQHARCITILSEHSREQQHNGVSEDANPCHRDARDGRVLTAIHDVTVKAFTEITVGSFGFRVMMVERQGRHSDSCQSEYANDDWDRARGHHGRGQDVLLLSSIIGSTASTRSPVGGNCQVGKCLMPASLHSCDSAWTFPGTPHSTYGA